jgi:hypothetical protein
MKKIDFRSLWTLVLLALTLPLASNAMTLYTSHASPSDPSEFSSSITGGCGTCAITDAVNAADASLANFGTVSMPVGSGTGLKLRIKLSTDFTGGGYSGFLVENTSGILDGADLNDIAIITYYQGTRVDSLDTSTNLSLHANGGNMQFIEIQHTGTIDEIAILFRGLALDAWDIRVYYGYASDASIMPIELSAFQGTALPNGQVQLNWTTEQESNNSHFIVERSLNGNVWEELARVDGAGTSQAAKDYTYIDAAPQHSMNLYRLRQVDFDGNFTHSNILSVDMNQEGDEVRMGPNPAVSTLNLMIQGVENDEYAVEVFDVNGAMLHAEVLSTEGTSHTRQMSLSTLPEGVYLVRVTRPGKSWTERVLVAR